MKIISKVRVYFVLTGFILGCSAPKQPYYFSRYSNLNIEPQKTKVIVNSLTADSYQTTLNITQNDFLLTSTSTNSINPSFERLNNQILDQGTMTKIQIPLKSEKKELRKIWREVKKNKSRVYEDTKAKTKKVWFYVFGIAFALILLFLALWLLFHVIAAIG